MKRLLIEEGSNIEKEYYIGLVLDSATDRVTLMGSEEGGVDIEAVADATPEKIFKEVIDPVVGLTGFQARRYGFQYEYSDETRKQSSEIYAWSLPSIH